MHHGSCLCGAIRFTVDGDLPLASACHCTQCRKHTGHHEVGIDVPRGAVTVTGEDKVTWYFSSEKVRRGFCSVCGSSMFFDILGVDRIGLNLGSFDGPTNTRIALHIFVANKGDYYDITDGAPPTCDGSGAGGLADGQRVECRGRKRGACQATRRAEPPICAWLVPRKR